MYNKVKELISASQKFQKPISELIIEQECLTSGLSRKEVWNKMKYNLSNMKKAVEKGQEGEGVFSKTGLSGGEAVKSRIIAIIIKPCLVTP